MPCCWVLAQGSGCCKYRGSKGNCSNSPFPSSLVQPQPAVSTKILSEGLWIQGEVKSLPGPGSHSQSCPLCIQPDTTKGQRRKEENENIQHQHQKCTISAATSETQGWEKQCVSSSAREWCIPSPSAKSYWMEQKPTWFSDTALSRCSYALHSLCSALGSQIPSNTRK